MPGIFHLWMEWFLQPAWRLLVQEENCCREQQWLPQPAQSDHVMKTFAHLSRRKAVTISISKPRSPSQAHPSHRVFGKGYQASLMFLGFFESLLLEVLVQARQ